MPLHLIQLTDKEWMDWNAVISIAHLLSANLKAGSYKGAIGDSPAAKALRTDLTALINASDKVIEVDDIRPGATSVEEMPGLSKDKAMELATARRSSEASNRGTRRGQTTKTPAAPETASTEPEVESTDESDNDPRDEEEDTGA